MNAYLATVHLLVDASTQTQAIDRISGLLNDKPSEQPGAKPCGTPKAPLISWSYLQSGPLSGSFVGPRPLSLPEGVDAKNGDLDLDIEARRLFNNLARPIAYMNGASPFVVTEDALTDALFNRSTLESQGTGSKAEARLQAKTMLLAHALAAALRNAHARGYFDPHPDDSEIEADEKASARTLVSILSTPPSGT